MTTPKRACDACHRRKVRCNGAHPCRNCTHASLTCTFNKPPQKKGPKGSRAKVISELRDTQKQPEQLPRLQMRTDCSDYPLESPTSPLLPGGLSSDLIEKCISFFLANLYPTMPVLRRSHLQQCLANMHSSIESYCLVSSLCAFMMIQPGIKPYTNPDVQGEPLATSNTTHGVLLLEETLRVRKAYDYLETPTIATVITSFFLSAGCFGLDRHNSAWFHLREATTLTHILGMHEESSYRLDDADAPRKRRLYWLLFVTEKAYGLQKHRPTTLHESIKLPTLDEEPGEGLAIAGFIHLVNLFRPFDETFIGLWNKTRTECSTAWLAQLQRRLAEALPENLDCTESQASDLRTTQQWLRTIVWQLSITNGFLSSTSSDSSMTFGYPIDIAQDLASVSGQLTRHSMELHGIGLIEKLFDVSCTLADVMSCVPIESTTFSVGPQDYLNRFLHLISTLRGGESRYVPLLVAKINTTLPAIASSFSQPLPVAVPTERMLEQYDSSNSSLSTPFSSPNFIYEDSSPLL